MFSATNFVKDELTKSKHVNLKRIALLLNTYTIIKEIGDMIYGMFNVLIQFLNENYRGIMKTIW